MLFRDGPFFIEGVLLDLLGEFESVLEIEMECLFEIFLLLTDFEDEFEE